MIFLEAPVGTPLFSPGPACIAEIFKAGASEYFIGPQYSVEDRSYRIQLQIGFKA